MSSPEISTLLVSVASTIVAALATFLSGYVLQRYTRRRRREAADAQSSQEQIASAVRTEDEQREARIVERVVERGPTGLSPEQLKTIVAELRLVLTHAAPGSPPSAVESLINNYHEQALGQARVQFWFSVVAAAVGFVWILFYGARVDTSNLASAAKTFPGVVMDAVAFLFFRQAADTRRRATELYDRLRKDKLNSDWIALVASI